MSALLVMTFSASDPTAGAGLQADLLTLTNLGCHALTVATGITVQDTSGVQAFQPVAANWVEDQARRLLKEMHIQAFKLGVLGSVENIQAVAQIIASHPNIPVIFDPVLSSGRGDLFADEMQCRALGKLLLPHTTILTPNTIEAQRLATLLTKEKINSLDQAAQTLITQGSRYVLITGGHENTPKICNTLYSQAGQVSHYTYSRLPYHYHGSGCTLASAIAAFLAHGQALPQALQNAQTYTWQTLAHAFQPGQGQYIPQRHLSPEFAPNKN